MPRTAGTNRGDAEMDGYVDNDLRQTNQGPKGTLKVPSALWNHGTPPRCEPGRDRRMTIHRLLLLSLSLLIVFVFALSWNQWRRYRQALILREPPRTSQPLVEGEPPDIIISRETTYITEPLAEDGLPDYEAYVWNKYGKGVTPENNAAVPIWRAVGPNPIPEKIRGELFQQLGMEALPLAGDYYIRTGDTNFVAAGVAWLLPLWGFRDVPVNRPSDDATARAIDDAERHTLEQAKRVFSSLVTMASEHQIGRAHV